MTKKVKTRMTGSDYKRAYKEIQESEWSLREHIKERLIQLAPSYPEMEVDCDEFPHYIRCDSLLENKELLHLVETHNLIDAVIRLEKENAKKEKVKQMKIKI